MTKIESPAAPAWIATSKPGATKSPGGIGPLTVVTTVEPTIATDDPIGMPLIEASAVLTAEFATIVPPVTR
jgi:hypothetical protein